MKSETILPKYLESDVLIRFEDCDPFGHLNNGRYIDYFLNAREDQVRENYRLDIYGHIKQTGNAWVVASNQIAYLREVKFMEWVKIKTCLMHFDSANLVTECQMLDKETGAVQAVIWSRFAYISIKKGQKTEHSPELMQLFQSVATQGEGRPAIYFEERVKELRTAPAIA
ncbi:acyl-CoA thioester hydrolase [Pontibacter aydingkolensis]|uniref:Acyl-CoA thioesterase n=1 Tax=Pontibacter aydingkolensis TaxID=1911536 RepID=A0ABS7CUP2_9BACT|nr:acyl-CoA thioesterase [Pontibacter aydingkolensis]MBW7467560.1 acyl-CoA thioesterase [Pontibacter aydingkolensis]